MLEDNAYEYVISDAEFIDICSGKAQIQEQRNDSFLFSEKNKKFRTTSVFNAHITDRSDYLKTKITGVNPLHRGYLTNIKILQKKQELIKYETENQIQISMSHQINAMKEQLKLRKKQIQVQENNKILSQNKRTQPKIKQFQYKFPHPKKNLLNQSLQKQTTTEGQQLPLLNSVPQSKKQIDTEIYDVQSIIKKSQNPYNQNKVLSGLNSTSYRYNKDVLTHQIQSFYSPKKNINLLKTFNSPQTSTFHMVGTQFTNSSDGDSGSDNRNLAEQKKQLDEQNFIHSLPKVSSYCFQQCIDLEDKIDHSMIQNNISYNQHLTYLLEKMNQAEKIIGRCLYEKVAIQNQRFQLNHENLEVLKTYSQYEEFIDIIKELNDVSSENWQQLLNYTFANLVENEEIDQQDHNKYKKEYFENKLLCQGSYYNVDNIQRRKFLADRRRKII